MKKSIIIVILFGSFLGYLAGNILFKNYKGNKFYNENGNIYYIQYGVYSTIDTLNNNIKKLDNPKIIEEDGKYYVYLGVTANYDNALKIQKMYKEKDIYTYIKSDYVKNSNIINVLNEYDSRLTDENIFEILKEILKNQEIFI